jgi:hypothetical protein
MAVLKTVGVIITKFTRQRNGPRLRDYLENCLTFGAGSTMFESPYISTAFYDEGDDAYDALYTAIENYVKNETTNNLKIMKGKMALAIIWLRSYAAQVVVIANLHANCTTREEAATNTRLSYLTPQKLIASTKGIPATPSFKASITDGVMYITITNGVKYQPTSIVFIAVAVPPVTSPATPLPVVSLDRSNAQYSVTSKVVNQVVSKSISGKGRSAKMTNMNTSPSYNLYAYAMHGNKLVSLLSEPVLVTIITTKT